MNGRWWRAYSSARHNPKLLRLPDKLFRWWFSLVCVASENGGKLPSHADLAAEFRVPDKVMTEVLDALVGARLFDHDETGIYAHDWNSHQYQSDVSTTRVKRFRKRQGNGERNVSVTPSESDTETDTDSVPNGTAGKPAKQVIFDEGLPWLVRRSGLPEKQCRSIVGKWLSEYGDDAVLAALTQAHNENPIDPVPWIVAKFKPRETHEQRRLREIREVLQ